MRPMLRFLASALAVLAAGKLAAQSTYSTPYTLSTLAGDGTAGAGAIDGPRLAARYNGPAGTAADAAGNLYVADTGNHTIRIISAAGAASTLAGSAGSSGSADGTGAAARFDSPRGVAVDAAGNVYVSDSGNHTIRKITPAGVVSTLAGSAGNSGSADGLGAAARFNSPSGVAVDGAGTLYVSDRYNYTIRKITAAGTVTTFAGTAGTGGLDDGTGAGTSGSCRPTGTSQPPAISTATENRISCGRIPSRVLAVSGSWTALPSPAGWTSR